jgi:precorrin-2 dehydrogenase / sirohydrochlorin ferrochelatase
MNQPTVVSGPPSSGPTPTSQLYPVMLDLRGRRVLVVGGGIIGLRKTEGLLRAGAIVTAVSPVFHPDWDELGTSVERFVRPYRPGEVAGYWLVVTATNDPVAQQQVFDDGQSLGVWVNAADDPDRCGFILTAVHRDGPVIVSVSTSGAAPALAGWLRDRLARALPPRVDLLARRLRAERDAFHALGQTTEGLDWKSRIEALVNEISVNEALVEDDTMSSPSNPSNPSRTQ